MVKRSIIFLSITLFILIGCSQPSDSGPSTPPPTYSVTYESTDADGGDVPVDSTGYEEDDLVTILSNTGSLARNGYNLCGWSLTEGADAADYEAGDTFNIGTVDVVLYAVWEVGAQEDFSGVSAVGDQGTVFIGEQTLVLCNAMGSGSITFPMVDDETGTGTIITPFYMGETEVTNAQVMTVYQWAYDNGRFSDTVSDSNGVDATTAKHSDTELLHMDDTSGDVDGPCHIEFSGGTFSVETGYEDHPVVMITGCGMVMFCNWLTEIRDGTTDNLVYTGIPSTWWNFGNENEDVSKSGYRMMASEEWEYAARYIGTSAPAVGDLAAEYVAQSVNGGDPSLTSGYYWTPGDYASGATADVDNASACQAVAVYLGNGSPTEEASVKSLGAGSANALNIYDMCGNVAELCYTEHPVSFRRIRRGGSWNYLDVDLGVGLVFDHNPYYGHPELGFRIVRSY